MSQWNDNTKAGEITTREGKRGIEFLAFNHEHKKLLCIGTLSGMTYEKTAPILQKPEPSFCLPTSELAAIEREGGQFIRFIGRGRPGTFSISLEDFKLHGEKYFNASYGYQVRVPLSKFAYSAKVAKRNAVTDNPALPVVAPLIKRERQMSLFG